MTAASTSLRPALSVESESPRLTIGTLLFAAGFAAWASAGVSLFAENRLTMAFWFVFTHLLLPMALLAAGSLWHALATRPSAQPPGRLIGWHAAVLLFLLAALPMALAFINLLPMGQTTDAWEGRVVSQEQVLLSGAGGWRGSSVVVNSKTLGPHLRFQVSNDEYDTVGIAARRGSPLVVEGAVVRGCTGVPIAIRLEPIPWNPLR